MGQMAREEPWGRGRVVDAQPLGHQAQVARGRHAGDPELGIVAARPAVVHVGGQIRPEAAQQRLPIRGMARVGRDEDLELRLPDGAVGHDVDASVGASQGQRADNEGMRLHRHMQAGRHGLGAPALQRPQRADDIEITRQGVRCAIHSPCRARASNPILL